MNKCAIYYPAVALRRNILLQHYNYFNLNLHKIRIDSMLCHLVFFNMLTLGVSSISQASGLAVPDASMHPVRASSDVMELMDMGLKNRAIGATALNERSSRSHRFMI